MSPEDIAALPVGDLAARDCALFMWITGPKLVTGAHHPILDAWGFRPVTKAFVWQKSFPNGRPYVGLGFYTRSTSEDCILAIRGKMPRAKEATNVSQLIEAPRRKHSEKPEEVYERIETLYPEGPYLELFARRRRNGWDGWGDEYPEES
jgi:site-specific DNA-methyltransferase (adenine-specific)